MDAIVGASDGSDCDREMEYGCGISEQVQCLDRLPWLADNEETYKYKDECSYEEDIPGGTRYWVPIVDSSLVPSSDVYFKSMESAIQMYVEYAEAAGFDTRRGTERKTKDNTRYIWKFMNCNKAGTNRGATGKSQNIEGGSTQRKRSRIKVTGCPALIRFKHNDVEQRYEVVDFEARHNHSLVMKENHDLMRKRRQLKFDDMRFQHRSESSNIGSSKAFRAKTMLNGGYANAPGQVVDWQNFKRDKNRVIGLRDGQFFIDKLTCKKKCSPQFYFEYELTNKKITSVFWADEAARLNYAEFGDVISFDGTFRTNKYRMVFVPFTGVDNHMSSVTFGAGLLSSETITSYTWLLEAFLKAHRKQPSIVVSDQDPSLLQAIAIVFDKARHRLCMWHIMQKLPTKVGHHVLNTTDLRDKLNKLVWNEKMDPPQFELKWAELMQQYHLGVNRWLQKMYGMRKLWISAYFKGIPMSGLMKTTSRSESTNAFFNTYLNDGDSFLAFFSCYESAMEKQRYVQRTKDHENRMLAPTFKTPTGIEKDASNIYTNDVFGLVQDEIYNGAWKCKVTNTTGDESCKVFAILQKSKHPEGNTTYEVVLKRPEVDVVCTCNHYVHLGVLCRHIYKVFIDEDIMGILKKYVVRRWSKNLIHPRFLLPACMDVDAEFERETSKGRSVLEDCYNILRRHPEGVKALNQKLDNIKKDIVDEFEPDGSRMSKRDLILNLLGVEDTNILDVEVPEGIRNKGTGRGKRMMSTHEKEAIAVKRNRHCKVCQKVGHDTRTCPDKGKCA